jgi:hypothetical protein
VSPVLREITSGVRASSMKTLSASSTMANHRPRITACAQQALPDLNKAATEARAPSRPAMASMRSRR